MIVVFQTSLNIATSTIDDIVSGYYERSARQPGQKAPYRSRPTSVLDYDRVHESGLFDDKPFRGGQRYYPAIASFL